jgi:hypothetical protein
MNDGDLLLPAGEVTLAQVETWFRQAASGVTAEPLQAWMNAVGTVETDPQQRNPQLQQSSLQWRAQAIDLCMTLLQQHADVSIRFYALTTLSRWQAVIHATGRQYALASLLGQQLDPQLLQQYAFFRNKVAAVLVHVCLLGETTQDTASAFTTGSDHYTHPISAAQSPPLLELVVPLQPPVLFCKVVSTLLQTLMGEYDAHQKAAVVQLKQTLRVNPSWEQSWLQQTTLYLQQALLTIAEPQHQQQGQHNHNDATPTNDASVLAVLALQTLQAFCACAAVGNDINDAYFSSLPTQILMQALQVPNHYPDVLAAALETWYEWITSPAVTATSLQATDENGPHRIVIPALLQTIHRANFVPYQGESDLDIEVVIATAKLVDAIGMLLVESSDGDGGGDGNATLATSETAATAYSTVPNPHPCWPAVWDLAQRAFAYDDIDVSAAVLPLVTYLVQTPEWATPHLPTLLQILLRILPYPEDFSYDFTNDDICAEEEMYRIQLDKLYKRMVQAAPSLVLQVVHEQTRLVLAESGSVTNSIAVTSQQVESVLRLVYHFVEGIRPAPGLPSVMQNPDFCQLLVALLHTSHVAHDRQHPQVLRLYFETAVRYYPLYQQAQHDELLSQLLVHLTGNLGLQHSNAQLRSRCCYLLLRLVKALITRLAPLVQSAVSGIMGLLENAHANQLSLLPDDTLYLFETIGLLLGKTGLSPADQHTYLAQIMTPHVRSMEKGLAEVNARPKTITHSSSNNNRVQDDSFSDDGSTTAPLDPLVVSLAQSISAITYLSKGFPKEPPLPVQMVFLETLHIALKVLESLPQNEPIRSKSMTLFQGLIQCLVRNPSSQQGLLQLAPHYLAPLIEHCNGDDCRFVAQLFNQIAIKCKADAIPALDPALLPFLHKCESLITAKITQAVGHTDNYEAPPHLVTERLGIQKAMYIVVEVIVTNQVTPLLLSPTNSPGLQSILVLVAEGAVHIAEPVVRKTCLHILRELVDQWVQNKQAPCGYARGLLTILYSAVLPGVLTAFVDKSFDERDAQNNRCVWEFAKLLYSLASSGEANAALASLYTTNAPAATLDGLFMATTAKAMELFLLARLSEWKGRPRKQG